MSDLIDHSSAVELAKKCEPINALEQFIVSQLVPVDTPLVHRFTPGLYLREIFAPAGTVLTTKIHKTEHPFIMLTGKVRVWTEQDGQVELTAPYVGVTKPGTRRVIVVLEDTRWITCHPSEETDLVKLEAALIEPHDIPQRVSKCYIRESRKTSDPCLETGNMTE